MFEPITTKTNRPIGVKPLNQRQIDEKYSDRKRVGKTARDKGKKGGPANT